jgi:hypothetical protein
MVWWNESIEKFCDLNLQFRYRRITSAVWPQYNMATFIMADML